MGSEQHQGEHDLSRQECMTHLVEIDAVRTAGELITTAIV